MGCHGEFDRQIRKPARGSFKTALLRAATELVSNGAELVPKTLHVIIPVYDGDVETARWESHT
jgi:NAD(P)H-dependent FMN reductase